MWVVGDGQILPLAIGCVPAIHRNPLVKQLLTGADHPLGMAEPASRVHWDYRIPYPRARIDGCAVARTSPPCP